MAVLSVGLGVIVLDGTIVGVALPSIITDLQLNLTQAQWVNRLYAVLLAALLLSTGKIADTWGRKRAFLIGLTIFVAGSVLAGFSTSAATLISACAVQEIGAAFIMSSVLSTVNAVFRGKYRAAAFGGRSAVISGEAAVGPLAGGARDFGCGVRAVYSVGKAPRAGSTLGAVEPWIVFLFHVLVGQYHRRRGSNR
ncbi:MFS transporter [Corynebacterium sp. MSK073]|uniref:MFS transporter n=1 Tax=Corynebacterium sp. LaCa78 TaxID=3391430 RepID=UPI00254AB15C|nr:MULTISPECIES: MFS transporter [unclassified Corynebacterium]MDK8474036.1 MFS transporter [Corynebacterium sp. MSK078]MDK8814932.1 MFS transporter [Corynebacterium sp. MSK073]